MFALSFPNPPTYIRRLNWVAFILLQPTSLSSYWTLLLPHPVMERFENRISSNSSYDYQKLVLNSAPHFAHSHIKTAWLSFLKRLQAMNRDERTQPSILPFLLVHFPLLLRHLPPINFNLVNRHVWSIKYQSRPTR